jgi:hypothetical protein
VPQVPLVESNNVRFQLKEGAKDGDLLDSGWFSTSWDSILVGGQ